jgi:hypothetical protein
MGTPEYMSPEQATNARDVSAATDVWAVGVMLYEALGGRPPFSGGSPTAVVVEVITQPHQPLAAFAPGAPEPLLALVDRCLSKKPELRPEDAGALRAELAALRQGIAIDTLETPVRAISRTTGPMTPPSGGYGTPSGIAPTALPVASPVGTPMSAPSPVGTPMSAPSPIAPRSFAGPTTTTKSGGGLRWALVIGGALFALTGLAAIAVAILFATDVLGGADTGQVRIVSNVLSGEIFVDGASKGPLTTGRILELPVGPRQVQARVGGAIIAEAAVDVRGGELVDVDLMSPEQRISAVLGPGDDMTADRKYADRYSFEWPAGTNVHLEANSEPVDTYLLVRFPDGTVHENDDNNGTNAGMDFRTNVPGSYEITVTSYRPSESGPYELYVRAVTP